MLYKIYKLAGASRRHNVPYHQAFLNNGNKRMSEMRIKGKTVPDQTAKYDNVPPKKLKKVDTPKFLNNYIVQGKNS